LRPDLGTLFGCLHKDSVQRKIRRAEREGLRLEEGSSESLLDSFWQLFLLTRWRHRAPPPPKRWFRNLINGFGEAAMLRVAHKGRRPVAAIFTIRHRDTLVYKYGCSGARLNNLGGMPFLFWSAIQYAKREGLYRFDLGCSDCDNSGLITFKDRLGAARSTLTYWRFVAAADSKDAYRLMGPGWRTRLARSLISRLPPGLFSAVGGVLYRHMG
jgi:lipid II:glycine glycyltransferase (peptidoglycan interpeptide bridge formation enzyme)